MMFDKNNTNFNGECLCSSCVYGAPIYLDHGHGRHEAIVTYYCMKDVKEYKNVGYANIMKILTNENYKGLLQLIADQKKEIIYLRSCIQTLKTMKEVNIKPMTDFQEVKKQFEAFMNEPTIIFPNTDPRGLEEPSNSEPEGLDNIY